MSTREQSGIRQRTTWQMQVIYDILVQTFRTLWAHKLRSFLTMFGIAWGVGSLLLLVGVGEGFRTGNEKELATMGPEIMFMFPGRVPAVQGSGTGLRNYYLTYKDAVDVRDEAKHVGDISPVLIRQDIRAQSEFNSTNGQVAGVWANFNKIRWLPMGVGRFLNDEDNEQRRYVAVIGDEMHKNLFPGRPALGNTILLNGVRFQIVGVLSSVGSDENNTTNFRVFIPYNTMRVLFPLKDVDVQDAVSFLNYRPTERSQHVLAQTEVRHIVARNHQFDEHDEDAFNDWDTVQNAELIGKIFTAMDMFLGFVGLVTLALGAIGIINIMLVSVAERTKEIGLRKALGATNRNILMQFFLEGIVLTIVSGGVGMGVAATVMHLLHKLPSPPGFDPPTLVMSSAILAIASLSLAGIAAGVYPARKAAALTPVEALRTE
jgi:putative ABC transport system permease protein